MTVFGKGRLKQRIAFDELSIGEKTMKYEKPNLTSLDSGTSTAGATVLDCVNPGSGASAFPCNPTGAGAGGECAPTGNTADGNCNPSGTNAG